MARDFIINGPCLVRVRGRSDSGIGAISELGLTGEQIHCSPRFRYRDLNVEAWGDVAVDVQMMLAEVIVTMDLIHFDRTILAWCIQESMASSAEGRLPLTGMRLGNNSARFTPSNGNVLAGNRLMSLNLSSPVLTLPWRFPTSYIMDPDFPQGAEKSVVRCQWRVIPFAQDPYNGAGNGPGTAAQDVILWDHTTTDG